MLFKTDKLCFYPGAGTMEVNKSSLLAKITKMAKPKKSIRVGSVSSTGAMAHEIASVMEALLVQAVRPEEARRSEASGMGRELSLGETIALEVLVALY